MWIICRFFLTLPLVPVVSINFPQKDFKVISGSVTVLKVLIITVVTVIGVMIVVIVKKYNIS